MIDLRQQKAFKSRREIANLLGDISSEDLDAYVLFPSRYIGMTIWQASHDVPREYFSVKLNPLEPGRKPWAITESFKFSYEKALDVGKNQAEPSVFPTTQALFN